MRGMASARPLARCVNKIRAIHHGSLHPYMTGSLQSNMHPVCIAGSGATAHVLQITSHMPRGKEGKLAVALRQAIARGTTARFSFFAWDMCDVICNTNIGIQTLHVLRQQQAVRSERQDHHVQTDAVHALKPQGAGPGLLSGSCSGSHAAWQWAPTSATAAPI